MQLKTHVFPLTIAYLIPLGDRVVIAPKVGVSYMLVYGSFGGQNDHDSSINPTIGLHVEGALSGNWGLRGQIDRYTGHTSLFGRGTFHQDVWVAAFGGVFKW